MLVCPKAAARLYLESAGGGGGCIVWLTKHLNYTIYKINKTTIATTFLKCGYCYYLQLVRMRCNRAPALFLLAILAVAGG